MAIKELIPLKDYVFVTDIEQGPKKTASGIIIPDDNMSESGIRNRWAKVWAVGPKQKDIKVGEWLLIQHGRWTNKIELEIDNNPFYVWRVDLEGILVVSETEPTIHKRTTL